MRLSSSPLGIAVVVPVKVPGLPSHGGFGPSWLSLSIGSDFPVVSFVLIHREIAVRDALCLRFGEAQCSGHIVGSECDLWICIRSSTPHVHSVLPQILLGMLGLNTGIAFLGTDLVPHAQGDVFDFSEKMFVLPTVSVPKIGAVRQTVDRHRDSRHKAGQKENGLLDGRANHPGMGKKRGSGF